MTAQSNHRFTVSGGAGFAYRLGARDNAPVGFAFIEGDVLDDPALPQRAALQAGTRLGVHWEPLARTRLGVEWQHRELLGTRRYDSDALVWASWSPTRNAALVLEAKQQRVSTQEPAAFT